MDQNIAQFFKFLFEKPNKLEDAKTMVRDGVIQADTKCMEQSSLLSAAVEKGSQELSELLLDKGADVNYGGQNGKFPLYLACKKPGVAGDRILKLLLERGADVNMQYVNGSHPLLEAVKQNDMVKIRLLLEAGADINACDNGGDTAIHLAAIQGNVPMAKMLIRAGAMVENSNSGNKWAKFTAGYSPLHYTAFGSRGGYPDMTELLIRYGAKVDVKIPDNGRTPLHLCAIRNSHLTAKVLIRHGCALNPISTDNNELKTPLHKAIDSNHVTMTIELITQGADLDITCQHSMTPLMLAMLSTLSRKTSLVRSLLQGGCDVNLRTSRNSHFEIALQLDQQFSAEGGNVLEQTKQMPYSIMVLFAGYKLNLQEIQLARQFYSQSERHQSFCDELSDPPSLQQTIRITIRKSMMKNVTFFKADTLNLPQKLKEYILLRDIF